MVRLSFAMKRLGLPTLCAMVMSAAHAGTVADSESRKIEYLISSVEQLSGAKFVRGGSAYDAKAAADHLRLKLRYAGKRVRTADDFIRLCGSRSSISGQAYEIRFADGTLVTSEAFLRRKLAEIGQARQMKPPERNAPEADRPQAAGG